MPLKKLEYNFASLQCFESIEIFGPIINKKKVKVKISIKDVNGNKREFNLYTKYNEPIGEESQPLLKIA